MLPSAADIVALQDALARAWHRDEEPSPGLAGVLAAVARNHSHNFELWHLEDRVRDVAASDAELARLKRSIDAANAARNREIEEIDRLWEAEWPWIVEEGPLPRNTETVGSVVDRLSIAALKVYHLAPGGPHPEHPFAPAMIHRRDELAQALDELLKDLAARRRRVLPAGQAKLYSSPGFDARSLPCGTWPLRQGPGRHV